VVDELVRSGLLSALANLADLDMGEVSNKLMPLKDEVVMVLVREEEIGEPLLAYLLTSVLLAVLWKMVWRVMCTHALTSTTPLF
jgi:hypothetical protein